MLDSWLPFLIYGIFAAAIPATMVAMSFLFATRPAARTRARGVPFESGVSAGPLPEQRFTVSFYLTAMLFIVFDIEIVFLYPLAVVLDELAWFGFVGAHRLHRHPRARLRLRLAEGGARMALNVARLRLAPVGETMFPPRQAPFFLSVVGEPPGSPTPRPHVHGPGVGP